MFLGLVQQLSGTKLMVCKGYKFADPQKNCCLPQFPSSCALLCPIVLHLHTLEKSIMNCICLGKVCLLAIVWHCSFPNWHTLVRVSGSRNYSSVWVAGKLACQCKWTRLEHAVPYACHCFETSYLLLDKFRRQRVTYTYFCKAKGRYLIPSVERDEKFRIIIFRDLPGTSVSF